MTQKLKKIPRLQSEEAERALRYKERHRGIIYKDSI